MTNMDDKHIRRITADAVRMALQQDREERESRIATEAAVAAALANQTQQVQTLRRPELPAFDSKHIDVWICRIRAAYVRSNITNPKSKFAFLETKFNIDDDPNINAFFAGRQTEETWEEFLEYLQETHGRTTRQQVNSILNGTP